MTVTLWAQSLFIYPSFIWQSPCEHSLYLFIHRLYDSHLVSTVFIYLSIVYMTVTLWAQSLFIYPSFIWQSPSDIIFIYLFIISMAVTLWAPSLCECCVDDVWSTLHSICCYICYIMLLCQHLLMYVTLDVVFSTTWGMHTTFHDASLW